MVSADRPIQAKMLPQPIAIKAPSTIAHLNAQTSTPTRRQILGRQISSTSTAATIAAMTATTSVGIAAGKSMVQALATTLSSVAIRAMPTIKRSSAQKSKLGGFSSSSSVGGSSSVGSSSGGSPEPEPVPVNVTL